MISEEKEAELTEELTETAHAEKEAGNTLERKGTKLLTQIGIVLLVCLVGEGIAKILPIPFPGSVLAMILLFLLLVTRVIRVEHIQSKAEFMLKNMAFFFIPSGISILDYLDAIKGNVFPLLCVCVVSTVITFLVTAYTVKGVMALQARFGKGGGRS